METHRTLDGLDVGTTEKVLESNLSCGCVATSRFIIGERIEVIRNVSIHLWGNRFVRGVNRIRVTRVAIIALAILAYVCGKRVSCEQHLSDDNFPIIHTMPPPESDPRNVPTKLYQRKGNGPT
jgi:hypothetical protein